MDAARAGQGPRLRGLLNAVRRVTTDTDWACIVNAMLCNLSSDAAGQPAVRAALREVLTSPQHAVRVCVLCGDREEAQRITSATTKCVRFCHAARPFARVAHVHERHSAEVHRALALEVGRRWCTGASGGSEQ